MRIRATEMHRRHRRAKKLRVLRLKHAQTKRESEQQKILEKMMKIAPWLTKEEFLRS